MYNDINTQKRNILKTAPCRACSTLPNLYSLTTVLLSPLMACFSIITEPPSSICTNCAEQTIRPWVILCLYVEPCSKKPHGLHLTCWARNWEWQRDIRRNDYLFWSLIARAGCQTSWLVDNWYLSVQELPTVKISSNKFRPPSLA